MRDRERLAPPAKTSRVTSKVNNEELHWATWILASPQMTLTSLYVPHSKSATKILQIEAFEIKN